MTDRVTVPSFLGGVSQQSPVIRNNNLVEDATNIEFLVSEGATRRYPTQYVQDLADDFSDYRAVGLEREDKDYVILMGKGDIKVFEDDGTAVDVVGTPTYLAGATYNDIRTQTIADTIFVANRATKVLGAPGKTSASWVEPGEAGVFVKQVNYGVRYTIKVKTVAMAQAIEISHTVPSAPLSVIQVVDTSGSPFNDAPVYIATANQVAGIDPFVFPFLFNTVDEMEFQRPGSTTLSNEDFTADPYTKEIFHQGSTLIVGEDLRVHRRATEITFPLESAIVARRLRELLEINIPEITTEGTDDDSSFRIYSDTAFEIFEVRDTQSDTYMTGWRGEVERITDLPRVFKHGAVVRITGENVDPIDDYYVVFASQDWADTTDSDPELFDTFSTFGQGGWNETTARDLPTGALDATTMPHKLQRLIDTDGSVTGTIGEFYFEWSALEWDERDAGDDLSNEEPSFVGNRINDIYFHQNRLGVLSETEVILSESGETTNFWRTSVLAVTDSDRVDFTASDLDGDSLQHAVPFDSSLLVFSEHAQALITGEPFISPVNVQAPVISAYRAYGNVSPAVLGRSVFFGYSAGKYAAIREFIPSGDQQQRFQDELITLAVPRYIPEDVRAVVSGSVDQMLAVLTGDKTRLYIYQFARIGGNLIQASWTSWQFTGDIEDVVFLESRLLVLVTREGNTSLELIELGAGRTETAQDFIIRLDTQVVGTFLGYDRSTDLSTWQLPWTFTETEDLRAALGQGGTGPYGAEVGIEARDVALRLVRIPGDYTGQPVVFGRAYTSTLVLSKPLVKQERRDGSTAILGGSTLVRDLFLYLDSSGYLKATVDYVDSDSCEDEFLADMVDVGQLTESAVRDGQLRVGVHADVEEFKITLSSSSSLPFTLVNGAWDIRFNAKHRIV